LVVSDKKRRVLEKAGTLGDRPGRPVQYFFACPDNIDEADIVLSKVSDFHSRADAMRHCQKPQLVPIPIQATIADRVATFERLRAAIPENIPKTWSNRSLDEFNMENLPFPVILKTQIACGPPESHLMSIATTRQHIEQYMRDERIGGSIICQELIDHGSEFFKVFVIGDQVFVFKRPSIDIKSIVTGQIFVPSQYMLKNQTECTTISDSDRTALSGLANQVSDIFSLSLFGIDVIQNSCTGHLLVVDVNYFPNFAEISGEKVGELLDQLVIRQQPLRKR
jgi:glutathione synthase/RimK-type ligase-like ATP-grasp enzyme